MAKGSFMTTRFHRILADFELNRRALSAGLDYLDQVELHIVFRTRALVMKNVPFMMKGVFRVTLTIAMGEVLRRHDEGDELREERGWKMLMLPRMLSARPRGGRISQRKLQTGSTCSRQDNGIC